MLSIAFIEKYLAILPTVRELFEKLRNVQPTGINLPTLTDSNVQEIEQAVKNLDLFYVGRQEYISSSQSRDEPTLRIYRGRSKTQCRNSDGDVYRI